MLMLSSPPQAPTILYQTSGAAARRAAGWPSRPGCAPPAETPVRLVRDVVDNGSLEQVLLGEHDKGRGEVVDAAADAAGIGRQADVVGAAAHHNTYVHGTDWSVPTQGPRRAESSSQATCSLAQPCPGSRCGPRGPCRRPSRRY